VKKISEEPKELVDHKKTDILLALDIFKDTFVHSYTVSVLDICLYTKCLIHVSVFPQYPQKPVQRYKIKQSISEKAFSFLE